MSFTEEEILHNRRTNSFEHMGFQSVWAEFMAESTMSLVKAKQMLENGCPPEILVQIAA